LPKNTLNSIQVSHIKLPIVKATTQPPQKLDGKSAMIIFILQWNPGRLIKG